MNQGNQAGQGQNGKQGQASVPGQEGAEVGRRAHPGAPGEGAPSRGPAKRAQPEQPGSQLEETLADKLLGDPPDPSRDGESTEPGGEPARGPRQSQGGR